MSTLLMLLQESAYTKQLTVLRLRTNTPSSTTARSGRGDLFGGASNTGEALHEELAEVQEVAEQTSKVIELNEGLLTSFFTATGALSRFLGPFIGVC
jgi:hypothetical protein